MSNYSENENREVKIKFLDELKYWLVFLFIVAFTIPYIIGAFIGDWIGRRRKYRLPLSP